MELGRLLVAVAIVLVVDQGFGEELDIRRMHIRSDIKYRFSTTVVNSLLRNEHDGANEATFEVVLPKSAFISNFSMEIDGVVYPGIVKEKEQARRDYQAAVAQGQSAAHVVEKPSRNTNKFQVSVNVAAHSDVIFDLTYQELLQRKIGLYEQVIYVKPGQVVQDLQIDVFLAESREITRLIVPPLRNDIQTEVILGQGNSLAEINRTSLNTAHVRYRPSVEQQQADTEHGVDGQFVVEYDVQRSLDAGQVEVVDGYFVHFFAPSGLEPVNKNVLFILDVSGSMYGQKIQQVKESMLSILDDLRDGDFFNIITFNNRHSTWRNQMVPVHDGSIASSKEFVNQMVARGSTDILQAVSRGIRMLDHEAQIGETRLASLIVFLTDGMPTSGETNTATIIREISSLNNNKYTLFSLGYGTGVNYEFLQKLSARNRGLARKIYHDSDAALQLKGFYEEIANPVLSNVHIQYLDDSVDNNTLTKTHFPTFFDGSEIVIAGKLRDDSVHGIRSQITAESATGTLELDLSINDIRFDDDALELTNVPSPSGLSSFVETMWAYLTIKELLNDQLKATNDTEKEALKEKALAMSLRYNFVTPLTSMVATKPNDTLETGDAADPAEDHELPGRPFPVAGRLSSPQRMVGAAQHPRLTGTYQSLPRYSYLGPSGLGPRTGGPAYSIRTPPRVMDRGRQLATTRRRLTTTTTRPTARTTTTPRVPTTTSTPTGFIHHGIETSLRRLGESVCFDNDRTSSGYVQLWFENDITVNAQLTEDSSSRITLSKVWLKTSNLEMKVQPNKIIFNGTRYGFGPRSNIQLGNNVQIQGRDGRVKLKVGFGRVFEVKKVSPPGGSPYLTVKVTVQRATPRRTDGLVGYTTTAVTTRLRSARQGHVRVTYTQAGVVGHFTAQRRTDAAGNECLYVGDHGRSLLGRPYEDFMVPRLRYPSRAPGLRTRRY